jgi:hypothetical protein
MSRFRGRAAAIVLGAASNPVAGMLLASAIYGATVGLVHSPRYALLNTVKLPMLLAGSIAACAVSHFVAARFLGARLLFRDVLRLVIDTHRDISLLLASLSPVCLLFALTVVAPTSTNLGEYPRFLAANVALIAVTGTLSLLWQARRLLREHSLGARRAASVVTAWLLLSLVVGGQLGWYLRPFFGNRAVVDDGSFCLGERPDFRGDRSFYEAVAHLAVDFVTRPPGLVRSAPAARE